MYKAIFAWEQFKEEAAKAAQLNGYLVFAPSLGQFNATTKPHQDDEIIHDYSDVVYGWMDTLHDLVNAFAAWYEHNGNRL